MTSAATSTPCPARRLEQLLALPGCPWPARWRSGQRDPGRLRPAARAGSPARRTAALRFVTPSLA